MAQKRYKADPTPTENSPVSDQETNIVSFQTFKDGRNGGGGRIRTGA